jgi:hypothetical protein
VDGSENDKKKSRGFFNSWMGGGSKHKRHDSVDLASAQEANAQQALNPRDSLTRELNDDDDDGADGGADAGVSAGAGAAGAADAGIPAGKSTAKTDADGEVAGQPKKGQEASAEAGSFMLDSDSSDEEADAKAADWASLYACSSGIAESISSLVGPRRESEPAESYSAPPAYLKPYTYKELHAATAGFAVPQILGCGGFATVFRGKIQGGNVAVKLMGARVDFKKAAAITEETAALEKEGKKLPRKKRDAHLAPVPMSGAMVQKQCVDEAAALKGWSHPHVCRLLGTCSGDGPYRCLVFELMDGGCLLDRLTACRPDCPAACYNAAPPPDDPEATTLPLSWQQRVQIAVDVGEALASSTRAPTSVVSKRTR